MGEEVVGSRVLIHTAYQIGDGIEEMLLLHHGCIENHVVAEFLLGTPHMVGHSFEHLEAEAVFRRLVHLRQQVGIGDGEKIV